jgi:hypothetical protein
MDESFQGIDRLLSFVIMGQISDVYESIVHININKMRRLLKKLINMHFDILNHENHICT